MSDYAFVVERARKAFSSVARLEDALSREPHRIDLQVSLAAIKKRAARAQEEMYSLAAMNHVELCNYRLLPERADRYPVRSVSKSLLSYQDLFSQVHDAIKNGVPKMRAHIGRDALSESLLELGYFYEGSLGVLMLAASERDFYEGRLDRSISSLYDVIHISDQDEVRDVAKTLGAAVVRRVYDWSESTTEGGFAADVRWNRSDGRQLGEVVNLARLERIIAIIKDTSDEQKRVFDSVGMLVGGDLMSSTFHFVEPDGESRKGHLDREFDRLTRMELGKSYSASIRETSREHYATQRIEKKYDLLSLKPAPPL